MKIIENKQFDEERALYNESNIHLINCSFKGEADGESALKESSDVLIDKCQMDLRYPFWHVNNIQVNDSLFTLNCRAPLWYSNNIEINKTELNGIKALRECKNINIVDSSITSAEFSWKSNIITIKNSSVNGEYAFFESNNVTIDNLNFSGKYSFQYVNNLEIKNSNLNTKDAFWHANNVTVYDSVIKGEYLGWYASNIKFVRCKIIGTQPLCYVKSLVLEDCEIIDGDLAFEYSEVRASIIGKILSIKNPLSGKIIYDECGEIINQDAKYKGNCEIVKRNNQKVQ